jgi:Ca2+-binding RTX toxin-like protein
MAIISGTPEDDTLIGTAGPDQISGEAGHDTIRGLAGDDVLEGGDGNDRLFGGLGNDWLSGGSGHDTLSGGEGDDILIGGAGFDRATFGIPPGSQVGVVVSLLLQDQPQSTGHGTVTLSGIEGLIGSTADDLLIGDDADNFLVGGGGSDDLVGNGGDDLLAPVFSGSGDELVTMAGGTGVDTVSFLFFSPQGTDDTSVIVSLEDQGLIQTNGGLQTVFSSIENLSGTIGGDDTLVGDSGKNILAGDAGSDRLVGGPGDDLLLGDGAIDAATTRLPALFSFQPGPIQIFLSGRSSSFDDPSLPSRDELYGGSGGDTLIGGEGADLLSGGLGRDRFVFLSLDDSRPDAADLIIDFSGRGAGSRSNIQSDEWWAPEEVSDRRHSPDIIDLSAIDADILTPGDQAFRLRDTLTGRPGEASVIWDSNRGITELHLDVDGDAAADMVIAFAGQLLFVPGDFNL